MLAPAASLGPMTTYAELVEQARRQIREVTGAEAAGRVGEAVFIDCRELDEYEAGAIAGAVHIPRGVLESNAAQKLPNPATEVIIYCAAGSRSALAALSLQQMGYGRVASLAGGFESWKREGRDWQHPPTMGGEQRSRYARHLALPDVGEAGQRRLMESRVLVVGAGGLGSPAALYLAAAGIGTLGIVDYDVVELSNLQRQVLHGVDRIGVPKVDSARQTLGSINPDVEIIAIKERLSAENAVELVDDHDVVVDGTDNFPTRYLLNDASLHTGTPVVHGSVFQFEGQVTVFDPYNGPCYRCLSAQPPPPELAPNCAEAGVLGVLPGVVGSLQALETIKLLLGIGDPLIGSLLVFDGLESEFRQLTFSRDPQCRACADPDSKPEIVEYDQYC